MAAIDDLRVVKGSLVATWNGSLTEIWKVVSVAKDEAQCIHTTRAEKKTLKVEDLVVVRQFGDRIFPALVPMDKVENGPADAPWHTLIEADNHHALELLRYLHAGEVDCIYIDPPYNTGARDWKYNNDYVDVNDRWRHSKWLAMMRRRLLLAKDLLNPSTGVLIVTIDEHEVLHLGMLLEELFPTASRQIVTIVINQKGVAQGRLSRAEEYAIFVFMSDAYLPPAPDDLLSPDREGKRFTTPRWEWLLRGGTNSRREERHLLFFPIFVDPKKRAITGVGEALPLGKNPNRRSFDGTVAWPIRRDSSFGRWRVSPPTLRELISQGFVRLGG